MIPSTKKRKLASMVKVEDDEDELRHSAKRRSVGIEDKPARSPSSYLPYRSTPSPTSTQYTTPTPTNPITLRLFVRELLRRSKTSVQTLEVALCYLDGVEDTVKTLRESYRSGKGCGTPELAEKGPYDEGSKDEGRVLRLQDVVNTELIKLRVKVRSGLETPMSPTSDITAAESSSSTEKQLSAVAHKVEGLSVDAPYSTSTFSSTATAVVHAISPSVTVSSESTSCPLIFRPPKMTPHQLLGTHPLLDARRTFLSALVLATKFLQDRAYSNKAWAKLSGLPGKEVGRCERALGGALGWRLWVGKDSNGENIRGLSSPISPGSCSIDDSVRSPLSDSSSSPMPWAKVDDEGVHGVEDPIAAELIRCSNAARDKEEHISGFAKALEMKDVEGVLSIPGMREYIVLKNKVACMTQSQTLPQPSPLRRQGSALVAGMVELARPEKCHDPLGSNTWSSLAALEKETPIVPLDIQTWSEAVANLVPSDDSSSDSQPFLPPGYVSSSGDRSRRTPLLGMTERLPEDEISGNGLDSGSSSPLPPFVVEHQKKQMEALGQQAVQQQQGSWFVHQLQTGMQVPQFYSKPGGPESMSAAALASMYKPAASTSTPATNELAYPSQPQLAQSSSMPILHISPPAGSFTGSLSHGAVAQSMVYMSPYYSPDDAPTPTQHSSSTPSCSGLSRDATLVDAMGVMDDYLKVPDGDRTPVAPLMMQPYF
ncbi:hypothetical protein FRC02_005571 [Tulasnella sp. 418]|nr:hypothetical protein FRC02_005571 [Tulasnella sp. 418]